MTEGKMKRYFVRSSRLVFDLGMNNGDDSSYYLHKGYRVVAVEANAALCEAGRQRFAEALASGDLAIHHLAIWEQYDRKTFFVNLDNDHWSSLDIGWAGRDDSACEGVETDCVPVDHLFALHGVPGFIKIDIEGADHIVLDQLDRCRYLPYYLSLEDCRFGFDYLETLHRLGYSEFKLMNQAEVAGMQDDGFAFKMGASGPFGEDVPGKWFDYEEMVDHYSKVVRDRNNNRHAPRTIWWDIHARGPQDERVI